MKRIPKKIFYPIAVIVQAIVGWNLFQSQTEHVGLYVWLIVSCALAASYSVQVTRSSSRSRRVGSFMFHLIAFALLAYVLMFLEIWILFTIGDGVGFGDVPSE